MRRLVWVIGLAVCLWPLLSGGATREEFLVRTTQDYVALCSTSPHDPLYAAAIGFCHGYAVGAYHYYQAQTAGPQDETLRLPARAAPVPGSNHPNVPRVGSGTSKKRGRATCGQLIQVPV